MSFSSAAPRTSKHLSISSSMNMEARRTRGTSRNSTVAHIHPNSNLYEALAPRALNLLFFFWNVDIAKRLSCCIKLQSHARELLTNLFSFAVTDSALSQFFESACHLLATAYGVQ